MIPSLVSTIIPVYNRAQMVRAAVASVLAQSYRPIEVIVVDDGSTDETPYVVEELTRQHPDVLVFHRIENAGPGPAREAGCGLARGEFIQYLDSDDLLQPTKFEIQVAALRRHPECGIAYGRSRLTDLEGNVLAEPFKWTGRAIPELFPGLLVDRWWCTHTPLYRRTVCDAVGHWSDLRWSQDWDYDARLGALRTRLVHCPVLVSDHRQHSGTRQTSAANWLKPDRLQNRVRLLRSLFDNARKADVPADSPEWHHFSRWSFAIARRCASVGLTTDSQECLAMAEATCAPIRQARASLRLFRTVAAFAGWRLAGRLACGAEMLRSGPGPYTLPQSFARM